MATKVADRGGSGRMFFLRGTKRCYRDGLRITNLWGDFGETMSDDQFRTFLLVLRRALLMIIRWIEKNYSVE